MARLPAILVPALALLWWAAPAEADDCGRRSCIRDDEIEVRLDGIDYVRVPGRADPKEYLYSASCYIDNEVRQGTGCIDGTIPEPPENCESGHWIAPRWARIADSGDGTPGPWVLEVGHTCPGDDEYFPWDEFARLPIPPSPMNLQPDQSWVYAGIDTIAYTEDTVHGFVVESRGQDFYVAAVADTYSWDFGDGSDPIVTKDPGSPWPDYTIGHTYTSAGYATPSLTTTWKGLIRTDLMDPWGDIPGTGETITTGEELRIYTGRTRLVEDPLS